ncbi:MAG: hypothetical protein U0R28_04965 [Candidatus Nanopelagicales bacterium]
MRVPSIIIVVSVVAAGLLGAPAQAATDLLGSLSYAGHTITWSTAGVAPASGDLVGRYDAVVTAGQTVTFSGSAAYTQGNAVTNLRQEAYLTNVTPVSFAARVNAGTFTLPFSLSYTPARVTGTGVVGSLTAALSSRNCNDWGVCGGPEMSLSIAILGVGDNSTPPPASGDSEAPRVRVAPSHQAVRIGHKAHVAWRVSDDSGKAKWFGNVYSDGTVVMKAHSKGYVQATGGKWTGDWRYPSGSPGPFYECFWAKDKAGNTSANAPYTACRWLTIQVPVPLVSNGCGGSAWGQAAVDLMNWAGDVRMYGSNPVNMRQACNQHDAGYAGVTVAGMRSPAPVDYRTWSREDVDQKFAGDLMAQCHRFLKGPGLSSERKACLAEVPIYVGLVRQYGEGVFDADVTVAGTQTQMPAATTPPGGVRVNL